MAEAIAFPIHCAYQICNVQIVWVAKCGDKFVIPAVIRFVIKAYFMGVVQLRGANAITGRPAELFPNGFDLCHFVCKRILDIHYEINGSRLSTEMEHNFILVEAFMVEVTEGFIAKKKRRSGR